MLDYKTNMDSNYFSTAVFSDEHKYRYALSRDWEKDGSIVVWIMLNPSIEDANKLERTTLGCMKRSKNWGYSGMIILNLFALVSTDPKNLKKTPGAIGEFNDFFIYSICSELDNNSMLIAAWGTEGKHMDRDKEVVELLNGKDIYCLGTNNDGSPKHPLHISHSIEPRLWHGADDFALRG